MNLETCIESIMRRRWLTILLSVIGVLGLAAGLQNLTLVDVDIRNHFGKNDPNIIALEQLELTYALSDVAFIAVAPKNGTVFNRETLSAIEELTEDLWLTPYATRVDSITNYSHSEGFEDELNVELLIEDASALSDAEIERIKEIALGTDEIAGRLTSLDGGIAGLVVSIILPEDRETGRLEVTDFLREIANEARLKYPTIDYHLSGEPILNRSMRDAIDADMGILAPVALGAMLLLSYILIRSIWGTLAILVMLITVLPTSLGFAGWAGLKLFGESGAALFVLMAVTVAHSVHVIEGMATGMRQGMDRKQAAIHTTRLNIWPVFLTSFTTAIGFLSLNFASMPPFKVMGNVVAFGSMCAFVLSVTLLPAFLSVVPIRFRPKPENKLGFFEHLARFVISYRTALLCSFIVVTVVLVAGIYRIDLRENWLELLDESYEFRQSIDFLNENFEGVETYEYSLDSNIEDGVTNVEFLNKVEAFAQWFRAQPEVAHVFAVSDVMKRLNKNLHGDNPEYYTLPDNSDLAAQYLLLYEFSLPVGRDLNNLIDHDRAQTRVTVSLRSLSSKEKIELDDRARAWLRNNAPEMETAATGVSIVGARSIQRNIEGMLLGTIIAMSIVSLLLFIVFRSIRLGLVSLIPNFFPAVMAMGLWGHLVGEVGVAASVVTAIAFGIIVDDTIHLMTKYVRARKQGRLPSESIEYAIGTVGKALLTTTVVFGLGFMVFGASGLLPNQVLGMLVGITVVIALLADLLFLPPLLLLLDGNKDTKARMAS